MLQRIISEIMISRTKPKKVFLVIFFVCITLEILELSSFGQCTECRQPVLQDIIYFRICL